MAKVVVIGGGYGGITVAGGLDDVADVTLVEQKDQFVHHAAALRAAVDSVWGQPYLCLTVGCLTAARLSMELVCGLTVVQFM